MTENINPPKEIYHQFFTVSTKINPCISIPADNGLCFFLKFPKVPSSWKITMETGSTLTNTHFSSGTTKSWSLRLLGLGNNPPCLQLRRSVIKVTYELPYFRRLQLVWSLV